MAMPVTNSLPVAPAVNCAEERYDRTVSKSSENSSFLSGLRKSDFILIVIESLRIRFLANEARFLCQEANVEDSRQLPSVCETIF